MPNIPLLIDTDPGVDDALALLMAFSDPGHDVVGLTVVAGNVGLEHTVANALKLCEVAGREDIPVFPGCDRPLLHAAEDAAFVHGRDGFGDTGYAPAARKAESEHAALAILRASREHAGRLLLVALGPLTNLALALKLDPTLPERVGRCVVMGGAVTGHGNMTPSAEFNIGYDPEAAAIVFEAFPRIELADWEAVLRHGLPRAAVDRWLAGDDPRQRFYDAISRDNRAWSLERDPGHWLSADSLAMALALEPAGALELAERPLAVETGHGLARGATVVDWNRQGGAPDNAAILMAYAQPRLEALVRRGLGLRDEPGAG
jgi:purine nucleosidase